MATEVPKRIHLIGGPGRFEEGIAAEAITPGHLVKLNSDGELIKHNVAGGWAEPAFALEDALQGNTIADAYADNDRVFYVIASPGDVIYALLAAGESVDPSEFLTSNADGTFKVAGSTDIRVAASLETLDLSDSAETAAARLKIRVL